MERLNIGRNFLGDFGFKKLAEYLAKSSPFLTHLYLERCGLSDASVVEIVKVIKSFKHLQWLDLNHNSLSLVGIGTVTQACHEHISCRHLFVSDNKFDRSDLVKFLDINSTLIGSKDGLVFPSSSNSNIEPSPPPIAVDTSDSVSATITESGGIKLSIKKKPKTPPPPPPPSPLPLRKSHRDLRRGPRKFCNNGKCLEIHYFLHDHVHLHEGDNPASSSSSSLSIEEDGSLEHLEQLREFTSSSIGASAVEDVSKSSSLASYMAVCTKDQTGLIATLLLDFGVESEEDLRFECIFYRF